MATEAKGGKSRKQDLAQLQAATAGVGAGDKLEFLGKMFRLSDKAGIMPLLKYSHYAGQATLIGPAAGAMYAMLKDTIHEDDWDEFERHAMEAKAGPDDLEAVVVKCFELLTARPTVPPSGSASAPSARSES
jgi:hypothetical protein